MFHSIRSKLVVSGLVMAAMLAVLTYLTSASLTDLKGTLNDLHALQDFKSHVQAPQKDMNQFIGAIDKTVLLVELGQAEAAQKAYQGSVDAEQDISGEFEYLEKNGTGELKEKAAQAHLAWESSMEFQKTYAETVAKEHKLALVRPSTDPTKVVDAHTGEGAQLVTAKNASMSSEELVKIAEDRAASPVESGDNAIDGLEEATDARLDAEKKAGEQSLAQATRTVTFGSAGVFVAVLVLGLVTASSVSRPLTSLKSGSERIASGDLDFKFQNVPDDEVGAVIHSVEQMCGSLKDRIRTLEEVGGVVLLTGDEIEQAASAIEPKSPQVQDILEKAGTLRTLVGEVLKKTKA